MANEETGSTADQPANTQVKTNDSMGQVRERLTTLERRMEVVENGSGDDGAGADLLATLPAAAGAGAFITDEGVARATPCSRIDLGDGQDIVISKGAIGPLNEKQQALLCPSIVDEAISEERRRRLRAFQEASKICHEEVTAGSDAERVEPWLACMTREAKSRGVEL